MIPIFILAIEDDDDREFMTSLYMQYHNLMYKLIYDIVKNPWDTEDILQEVLVKLIDKISTLRSLEKQNRINYVAVACKNTAYNFFRDNKPHAIPDLTGYITGGRASSLAPCATMGSPYPRLCCQVSPV